MDVKDDQNSPGEILLMTTDLHLASFITVTIFLSGASDNTIKTI